MAQKRRLVDWGLIKPPRTPADRAADWGATILLAVTLLLWVIPVLLIFCAIGIARLYPNTRDPDVTELGSTHRRVTGHQAQSL